MNRPVLLVALGSLLTVSAGVVARVSTPAAAASDPSAATTSIVSAAKAVLSSLDDAGRAKLQFAFDDDTQRRRWSNFPDPDVPAAGRFGSGDLTATQRASVMTLLETALSADGYRKVTEIMRGDEVEIDERRPWARRRWTSRRIEFRRSGVLPGVSRCAVDDRALDAAVRRPSSGGQPHAVRRSGQRDAELAVRAACHLYLRRPRDSSTRPRVGSSV